MMVFICLSSQHLFGENALNIFLWISGGIKKGMYEFVKTEIVLTVGVHKQEFRLNKILEYSGTPQIWPSQDWAEVRT